MFELISHSLYAVFIAVALGVLAAPGAARPALNISTKNIEPIGVQGGLTASASQQAPAPVTVTPASVTPASAPQVPTKSRKP